MLFQSKKSVYHCKNSGLSLIEHAKFGPCMTQGDDDGINSLPQNFRCQLPDNSVWAVHGKNWVRLSIAKLAIIGIGIVAITPLPSPADPDPQYIPSYQEQLLQLETALQACKSAKCVGMYHAQIDRINAIVAANLPESVSMATQGEGEGEGEGQAAAQATVKEGK